jgi:hypothetical protein
MMGSNANIDELLGAVKSAAGDAKIDALADLIVGLFSRSQGMMGAGSMGGMMNMMGGAMKNGGMHGAADGTHQGESSDGVMGPQSPQPKR